MVSEKYSQEELVNKYKDEVESLSRYIPWFESKTAEMVSGMYKSQEGQHNFSFPVYDSTLLAFINEVGMTSFMNRNHQYVYIRYHIKSHEDEWRAIESANIMTMEIIGAILSKYVLGGITKPALWKEGVEYELYLRCLKKAKSIIEFWDKPLPENKELLLVNTGFMQQEGGP